MIFTTILANIGQLSPLIRIIRAGWTTRSFQICRVTQPLKRNPLPRRLIVAEHSIQLWIASSLGAARRRFQPVDELEKPKNEPTPVKNVLPLETTGDANFPSLRWLASRLDFFRLS